MVKTREATKIIGKRMNKDTEDSSWGRTRIYRKKGLGWVTSTPII
jgi:hypothetical protein